MPKALATPDASFRIAALAVRTSSLSVFREQALSVIARVVPFDGALFHALSPRVPLTTAGIVGIEPAQLARSQKGWDDLAVELGALRHAASQRLVASIDEVFARGSPSHARVTRTLYGLFRMRSMCIVHLIVRERVHAAVVLFGKRREAFSAQDLERLRELAPGLAVADALLDHLEGSPRATSPVQLRCRDQRLTRRQRQLVEHVALGHANHQIAEALGLSPNTVRNHLVRVFARVGASNRADLVRLAVLVPAP